MEKTIDAASRDGRFEPVAADELEAIELEISVITPRREIGSWEDIDLSKDGVVITNRNRSGTFLPQVARDTGWDLKTYLRQLCTQKAGLEPECYLDPRTKFEVYRAWVF